MAEEEKNVGYYVEFLVRLHIRSFQIKPFRHLRYTLPKQQQYFISVAFPTI